ncbi:phosphoserine aminotransferase [Alloscardovia macacae]|uniref:Phosphoserine aminotransferase n=2 Tax=Alloscardovia macacae TaxID=1160091 RepID=A0A1Y2SXY9_9BIFI|nr:phosphoserine transaminase [Alloscardovia macacae]OTA26553.1 phosphoserine aminotransferase [Alloscardovia macacae]OTA29075.1 phosphoserine aminotransferase [Alloscardovia macacae]
MSDSAGIQPLPLDLLPFDLPLDLLPFDLLPSDGRFGSGPSKIRHEQLEYLTGEGAQLMGTSHRQAPIKDVVASIQQGIRELYHLPDDYDVVLGNGGASAFWDMACACLIERKSAFGVYGSFSKKFADSAARAPFLEAPVLFEAEPGRYRLPEATGEAADADVFAWAHNETSTGVLTPVRRVHSATRPDALTIVDGTSAAAGTIIDPREVDVYYFSPQKGFGADGGLWVALASPRAIERAERIERETQAATQSTVRWIPPFLSFTKAVANSRKHQTLNTPAIATLLLMKNQIDWLLKNGGIEWAAARCAASANVLYEWAEASTFAHPFVADREARSSVVVTIDLTEELPASDVLAALRANGIVDVAGYRGLGRNQLRVGVFPSVETQDVVALTDCIDAVVAQLRA